MSEVAVLRSEALPIIVSVLILLAAYAGSVFVPVGWMTYLLSVPPLVALTVLSLEKANMICPQCVGVRWHSRRMAFVFLGLGAIWLLTMPLGVKAEFPDWRELFLYWGAAIIVLTSKER